MQFVHPEVLWALSALTLPVLVHLFSFRRHRKVQFSQTAFLREVRQESRSRNRIRHWLILLMRLLALACIILAFAEPVLDPLQSGAEQGPGTVSIYLDNSPSMELEGANGPLLEAAKAGAMALVESHGPTERFHVMTSAFDPDDRRLRTKEEALERLAAVRPGFASPGIQDVLLRQQDALQDAPGAKTAYVFSDLQTSSHQLNESAAGLVDTTLVLRFVTQAVQPTINVRVDSAWFDTPMRLVGRSEILHVRLAHDAQRPVDDLPLSLELNGRKAAIGSFNLVPGLPTDTVLRFRHETAGQVHAVVRTEDAPVTFDDDLFLGYEVADRVQVVLVQGQDANAAEQVALQRLFGDPTLHDVVPMSAGALDYDALAKGDLIVLQGVADPSTGLTSALLRAVDSGRSLFLLPPAESTGPGWAELLVGLGSGAAGTWLALDAPVRLGRLHHEHPLFQGVFSQTPNRVDLPTVRGWYNRSRPGPLERNLMSFSDGRPFLTLGRHGQGRYALCATPLAPDWTNLAQHALLVPMALRLAETARASGIRQFTAGQAAPVTLSGLTATAEDSWALRPVSDQGASLLLTPQAVPGGLRFDLPLNTLAPGGYDVVQNPSEGGDLGLEQTVFALGVNARPSESDLSTLDPTAWQQSLVTAGWKNAQVLSSESQDVVAAIDVLDEGQPAWLGLIALALAFLLLEMVLIKRTSASGPKPTAPD